MVMMCGAEIDLGKGRSCYCIIRLRGFKPDGSRDDHIGPHWNPSIILQRVLDEVYLARQRTFPLLTERRLSLLNEEVLEVTKEALDLGRPHTPAELLEIGKRLENEIIQVMAICQMWLEDKCRQIPSSSSKADSGEVKPKEPSPGSSAFNVK